MTATLRSPFNLSAHLRPTVGDQKISFTSVDHMGWMLCDGRALSVADYGLLFGVIGYTFGGSGSSFDLPAPAGRAIGVAGDSADAGITTREIGDKVGTETHTLTVPQMPIHNHGTSTSTAQPATNYETISGGNHTHDYLGVRGQNVQNIAGTDDAADEANRPTETTTGTGAHAHTLQSQGGSQPHNNMQPTLFAGNMFIYSGKNMQAYFPYTWVGSSPASSNNVAPIPGNVLVF